MRWRSAARGTGVGIALVTAAAGILLIAPRLIDVGIAVPQGYALLGAMLLVSALLSIITVLWSAKPPKSLPLFLDFALIRLPLLSIAAQTFVFGVIGAAKAHNALALLLIPAAGALLSLVRKNKPYRTASMPAMGLTPRAGRATPLGDVLRYCGKLIGFLLLAAIAFWPLPVGAAFYHVLKALLMGPAPMDFAQFLAKLADQTWYLVLVAVIVIALTALTLISVLDSHLRLMGVKDANRNLSLDEIAKIEAAYYETAEYVHEARYEKADWRHTVATLVVFLIGVGLVASAFFWFNALPDIRPDPAGVWLAFASDRALSVGFFVGTGVAVLVSLLPMIVLALFWTHYAERYGWARLTHNGGYAGLTSRLVLLTRLHRLPAPFSPPLFLRREGRRLSRFGLGVIVIGAILTALISYHDRSSITLVRQNGIDVIDWQSLRPTHYAFGELKMLELRCSIEKSGERKVAIWIQLPDNRWLNLANGQPTRNDSLTRIDGELRRLHTPVDFYMDHQKQLLYSAKCAALESEKYPASVLHLDDWKRIEQGR
ncbi:MAG: hypothetical protein WCA81_10430 [Rhizomicrobium sp.]